MQSRYSIVPPEEVVDWVDIEPKLARITYEHLLELISPNEKAIEFAARFRLIKNTRVCARCNQPMLIWSRTGLDGIQWRCMHMSGSVRDEGRKRNYCSSLSIRHGSVFHSHHLSIADMVEFMFMWSKNYPLHEIRFHTSFSSEMSVIWAGYMRQLAADFIAANSLPIGGRDVVVELGQLLLYRTKNHSEHPFLLGAVERDTGNCIIQVLENCSTQAIAEQIVRWIHPGSIIITTREFACEGNLLKLGYTPFIAEDYMERIILFDGERLNVNCKMIDDLCEQVKEKFRAMNGTSKGNFESYIQEFLFRKVFKDDNEFAGVIAWAPILHTPK